MKKSRYEYQKKYRENNREKLRLYKREWKRKWRRKMDMSEVPQRGRRGVAHDIYCKRKNICNVCTILLTSEYATGHNGQTCGQCLNKVAKNN